MHIIDNEKCRREREARLSSSRLDLNFCVPHGGSRSSKQIDSHGNTLTPISPQSNNNSSSIDDNEQQKITAALTPTGKCNTFLLLTIIIIQFK